jgi:hypothetical protein
MISISALPALHLDFESGERRDLNMSATNITSKCRIASIKLNGAMILAQVAYPDGSNIRRDNSLLLMITWLVSTFLWLSTKRTC